MIYIAPEVHEIRFGLDRFEDSGQDVRVTLRPISVAEVAWQIGRRLSRRDWTTFKSFLSPSRPFVVTESFPRLGHYDRWMATREPVALRTMMTDLHEVGPRPRIAILIPVNDPPPRFLAAAIRSVQRQNSGEWQLCIADNGSSDPRVGRIIARAARYPNVDAVSLKSRGSVADALGAAVALAKAPYVARLDPDDKLATEAVAICSGILALDPEIALLYTDMDRLDRRGQRHDPYFKPDFSRELLYSRNYLDRLVIYRRELVERVGGWRREFEGAEDHDLTLRILDVAGPQQIRHVPLVLCHCRAGDATDRAFTAEDPATEAGRRAVAEHLARRGVHAEVSVVSGTGYRVHYVLPSPPPRVSVIIPFRDRADLLRGCVRSLRERTRYPDVEIVLVDNDSVEIATRELLDSWRHDGAIRMVPAPGPFNYSALNNLGVARSSGDLVCFLNNDTEVISPDWLDDMVGYALQDGVGCVGAKLYYENGTVQHAGVVTGIGPVAGHVFLNEDREANGYFGRLRVASNYSAVTGACMLMRRSVFDEVGGFDEVDLPVAYNDIDLCLRVRAKGYRNVFTPFAELYHLESVSRGPDETPEARERARREVDAMVRRHGPVLANDSCYSPHLTRRAGDFSIAGEEHKW
ncbi:glycosyltransferase family 2 protein [Rhodoplanes serenus]|uniref:glycosyltransferase family 2 protein n=1 Tax=Rhodoplanes serenus TaxID=200615 RepID=UPI00147947BC|nr:glycosyltransferase family 2 protein [Rhodoplanes serenus]